ncbi:MAG: VOC family protein [Planctomycetota bacterium]|nr:VOC family protein [Planctomycetota bacterium]MDA1214469.1 VOC family protein [Planctomycetota bacterium]
MTNGKGAHKTHYVAVFFGLLVAGMVGWNSQAENVDVGFARTTVDFGIVVSDIDKSVAFYKDVIGATELDGFDVPADFAGETGLSNNKAFHVHVLVLGEDDTATKIKLMQFPDAPGKKVNNDFIHSSLGVSYLTVFVTDLSASLKRAEAHGVKPVAKGPVGLPEGFPEEIALACVRDPDGNLIELVGPLQE